MKFQVTSRYENMKIKEKIMGKISTITGVTSVLGSWQICHTICLGIVTLLALIGITITGMPLIFLTTITVPVWSIAVTLFSTTLILHIKGHACISPSMIILNAGILIAGIPFQKLQSYTPIFYTIGGTLVIVALFSILKEKKNTLKKYTPYITTGILLILLIGFITYVEARSQNEKITSSNFQVSNNKNTYTAQTTGTTGNEDVEITLTPTYNNGKLTLQIAVNTHSVDISQYNLARIALLTMNGKTYTPISAPTLTGHHTNGELIYSIPTQPKEFTITITGIQKIEKRAYTWR